MRKLCALVITGFSTLLFAGCQPPAENKPANNNSNIAAANTAKPPAAAPTKEALLDLDKKANEAWIKGDSAFFEGFLTDKFVQNVNGTRISKADLVKMVASSKCDVKSWSVEDTQMTMIDADTAILTSKGIFDGSCTDEKGKPVKLPTPVRSSSIYVRNGDKWLGAFHGDTLIMDPKNPPPPPPAAAVRDKSPVKTGDTAKSANSNTEVSKPAAAGGDANTEALAKIETAGWEAWKARDAKKLEELTTNNVSMVTPEGGWFATKADIIKYWTEGKCEVKSVGVSDPVATSLSPTVEVLTFTGSADGTCDGQKLGKLYGTSVYVKEGDSWKMAYSFTSPGV